MSAITYAGFANDPSAQGSTSYGRTPNGRLLSAETPTATQIAIPDRHGDVTALIDPTTSALSGSRVFDPFGVVAATTGILPNVGFQGDVTDAQTGGVWMGARWMMPSTGTFGSRDSYAGATPQPGTLNRYSYGLGNPLSM